MSRAVRLARSGHSLEAIQRAAYRLAGVCSVEIAEDGQNWTCTLVGEENEVSDANLRVFRDAVIDEALRERIREETSGVRNVILALAFSNTTLVDAEEG